MEVGIKKLNMEDLNRLKKYCIFNYSYRDVLLLCKYQDNKNLYNQYFEYNTVTGKYTIDFIYNNGSEFFNLVRTIF